MMDWSSSVHIQKTWRFNYCQIPSFPKEKINSCTCAILNQVLVTKSSGCVHRLRVNTSFISHRVISPGMIQQSRFTSLKMIRILKWITTTLLVGTYPRLPKAFSVLHMQTRWQEEVD